MNKYKMRTFKVVCGGETPEMRYARTQSEIMGNEQKRQNAERFADPILLTGDAEEQVKELLFAVKTYEQDLAMYRKYTKELEQKIKQLEASIQSI